MVTAEPDYVRTNQQEWDRMAHEWVAMGERAWAGEPSWGIWGIPESELELLPADMSGMDAVELGCGTGYVSAWMIRRGARVVGLDVSARQLATAQRLAAEHQRHLPLVQANAETVPLRDGSFDFAVSEYGAAIWADPYKWIPEAWRVLRPGGELVFLGNHPLVMLTQPRDADQPTSRNLLYPYFGLHRIDWDDGQARGTEFNLTISGWHRLFEDVGFEFVSYHELQSPGEGPDMNFFTSADWAHAYPSEQVWKVRKPSR